VKRGASISKRDFLQRSAGVAAAEVIGAPPEMGLRDAWAEGFRWVNRRCTHCSLACKMSIGMQNGEAIAVRRSKSAVAGGVLCFKAARVLAPPAGSSDCAQHHSVCVAGVVFKTKSGRARDVALRMAKLDGLEIIGIDADSQVTAIWKQWSFAFLEQSVNCVLADDDIEHLVPVFFGWY
jgi:hypothetical protein